MKTATSLYYKLMGNKSLRKYKNTQKLALLELRQMFRSQEYAKKVRFVKDSSCLLYAFKWSETMSGFKIWKIIHNIAMSK